MGTFQRRLIALMCLIMGILLAARLSPFVTSTPRDTVNSRPVAYWITQLKRAPEVRDTGTVAALQAAPDRFLPLLRAQLLTQDGTFRRALRGLARLAPPLGIRIHPADAIRRAAAVSLQAMGTTAHPAIPELVAALTSARDVETVRALEEALGGLGLDVVEPLVPLLEHPGDPSRRAMQVILRAFRRHNPESPTETLVPGVMAQLTNASPEHTRLATELVPYLRASWPAALPRLLANLESTVAPDVRVATAKVLGELRIHADTCVPALRSLLQESSEDLSVAAANALARFGGDAAVAVPDLERAAHRAEARPAIAAINSLGWIGFPAAAAVPMLVTRLEHPLALVRASAATALGRIQADPERAVPALAVSLADPDPYVRQRSARALAAFGTHAAVAVPKLVKALGDSQESVCLSAVEALGRIGRAASPAVPDLLSARNNNQSVMRAPVELALERIQAGSD